MTELRNLLPRSENGESEIRSGGPKILFEADWCADGYPSMTRVDRSGLVETSTRGIGEIPKFMTIYSLYRSRAERMADRPLYTYRSKDNPNKWLTKTAVETLEDIRKLCKGFIGMGLKHGEGVALMCSTRYEWNIVDAGVMSIGGVLSTIYDTDSPKQMKAIIENSGAKMLIVETKEMKAKAELAEIGKTCQVFCMEDEALDRIRAYGQSVSDEDLNRRIDAVQKTDLCSIVYTSGSTSAPKGVEITHENFCAAASNLAAYLPSIMADPKGSALLFLPMAHVFARTINYMCVFSRVRAYISSNFKNLVSDLQYSKPTAMIGVPRVYEKLYNAVSQNAGMGWKGRVFAMSVKTARAYMQEINKRGKPRIYTSFLRTAFDTSIYSRLRDLLGGRAKWLVCGGAPLDPNLLAFYRGAGIPVYEGYGLTETTAPCAFSPQGLPYRHGSVGIAFPGATLRCSEEGEIEVKGDSVFSRYHNNEEATREAFDKDGWCLTGDLGYIDDQGFLYVTGRKKNLIITAGGKNVAPEAMEKEIERCPLVSQVVVLGDRRPFVSALLTLDEPALRLWLKSQKLDEQMSLEEACKNPAVRMEIQKYIDEANKEESQAESVRKFIIIPEDFTQENGLLTPSMKIIRKKVMDRYSDLLNKEMYTPKKVNQ